MNHDSIKTSIETRLIESNKLRNAISKVNKP